MASHRIIKRTDAKKPMTIASFLRSFLIGLFIGVGVLGITTYTAVRWTQKNILDTENWVSFIEPIPKNPAVAEGLSGYIVTRVFDRGNVELRVAEALPERAAFLAPPLSDQLESKTKSIVEQLVTSDRFQTVWAGANRAAHQRLMEVARGDQTIAEEAAVRAQTFQLDISQIRTRIRERLGLSSPAIPAVSDNEALGLEADLQARPERLRRYVGIADFAYAVLPSLILASLLFALALARNRRRVLMVASLGTAAFALLQLIGVRAFRPVVLNKIQAESYRPAVGELYDSLLGTFNSMVYAVLVIALVIWALTLMAGSSGFFKWVRKYFKTSKLRRTDYYTYWQEVRMVVAAYKPYIWGGFVAVALFWLAFVAEVDWQSVTNTVLTLVAGMAFVQILGSPPYFIKAHR